MAHNMVHTVNGPSGIKLMRLGLTNRIVNDSDSKSIYFNRRFRSDSDSNDLFESTIAISIYNCSIFNILPIKSIFSIYYQLKYRLKSTKCQLFHQNRSIYIKKGRFILKKVNFYGKWWSKPILYIIELFLIN